MLMFLSANKHRSHYGYDKNHCGDWNFTLIDEMCVFSYESACFQSKELIELSPCYASITSKVPVGLTEVGGFTKTIQIFTVVYSSIEVVLVDFGLSQPTFLKEIRE